ncbi:MAG: hypothetical protein SXA11_04190 [Cyanobacteriota bacterium]|nr:hypothetical protein [Cyanobacteriota bacterium]
MLARGQFFNRLGFLSGFCEQSLEARRKLGSKSYYFLENYGRDRN